MAEHYEQPLHVGRPNLGDRDRFMARAAEIFDRNWLTNNGPLVREFEDRLCEITGVKNCIAMANGTIALELVIRALELKGEVIIPSYTFVATAHALQWQEITPVFCDIDPETHHVDSTRVQELITPRTTGIIGVHLWGRAAPVKALQAIADRHGLRLLFDAAHAFGCSYDGGMIGQFGAAEVFSFHATKFLNSFEGGAVATNDDVLAEKLRLMRNFGFAGQDNVIYIGTNGKMTEICAAMGLTSLESMDEFVAANRRNYEAYYEGLADIPGLRLLPYDANERNNYQYVIVEVDESRAGLSRDGLVDVLHQHDVLARRYFYPGCHNMEPYRSLFPQSRLWLPETERVAARVMSLPTGASVDPGTIAYICSIIRETVPGAAPRVYSWSRQSLVKEQRS